MNITQLKQACEETAQIIRAQYLPPTQGSKDAEIIRLETRKTILEKDWFKKSSPVIQAQLLGLFELRDANDCIGFLQHLAHRPTIIGGVSIEEMTYLGIPAERVYGIFVQFGVKRLDDDFRFRYQFFSWRQGPYSGSKGLVLVRSEGETTHLILSVANSFAAGQSLYDLPGGFFFSPQDFSKKISGFLRETSEEIGLGPEDVEEVIDIGPIHVDPGLTNNMPTLYLALIKEPAAAKIKVGQVVNPDIREMKSYPVIIPASDLWGPEGHVLKNTNGMFARCVLAGLSLGLLKGPIS
ncbi:MAG: hypothetical protein A3B74_04240 [Candidatus Kerfeldbacteria bacterium RIFCSPHIGHO2_02_FULL_42_14]|uniref:Nudix hydrolase domain-containing protein n=1 Tax=Candidatus Kerfeldbacteria bacterium RIFCSPHIGHO2_02_FULL_42_14 TaxID=1798540 RepID=A0A1G2ANP6_9BACT|nr:MAG: hypothetical protein A3B74_04240 [Candidatus Kerfeldbacteria bacterium RIFCSPHIGHO2_02_FULL_42_14]OGY81190.1 MAG: hypothetical protein A3E60_02780 [Candidatus Kerfeldbacteria bacterium RIFCSPHIGHO2_12_FULL_42_13]OGY83390.1 MAG: hypothetical protein A3I91_01930 [Candidatus Kerfeldbacteria bacterium RIFCSPLOWO2_02_FULL_42_19]OGY85487.1 MAG: hypothetical protein A3G01_03575 [Candidatus Kerfeldbacteria bacterium RIFCSPLOWO2_12_FULL_43_9]